MWANRSQGRYSCDAPGHSPLLQILALKGAREGGFDACELLRLCLEAAAGADPSTDAGQELIQAAAEAVMGALKADDAVFQAWPVRLR